jgi:hypothetical protein
MPDGTIVTEAEVVLFCPGIETLDEDTPEALILPMVEQSVKTFLKRSLEAEDFVQEVDIKPEISWHDVLIKSRDTFFTLDFPVNDWVSLAKVVSRDKTTGAVDQTQVLERDSYFVKLDSGIIRLLRPIQDIQLRPLFSFPGGIATMVAKYNAGFSDIGAIPEDIKLAVLMRYKRFHTMMKSAAWNLERVVNPQGGDTSYMRIDWTPEEKSLLEPYIRDALFLSI